MREPIDVLLGPDIPVTPRAEFGDDLLERCLRDLGRRHGGGALVALALAAAALVLATAATATYFALRPAGSPTSPAHPGSLTLITYTGTQRIAAVAALVDGHLRSVWHCPHMIWCGELESIAWSPDGKRLALTLGEIGGTSGYVGLHVVDVATGVDHQLGVPFLAHAERKQPSSVLESRGRAQIAAFGCFFPSQVAWSPDSQRLAYMCGDDLLHGYAGGWPHAVIYTIRADGTDRTRLRTGTASAYWPSWSPDGKRIAFSTQPYPRMHIRDDTAKPAVKVESSVYWVALDGSAPHLVARGGAAPAWTAGGESLAMTTSCGLRIVSAASVASPVSCRAGTQLFASIVSRDGSTIAVSSRRGGVYLFRPDGSRIGRATTQSGAGLLGNGRPAWAPTAAIARLLARGPRKGT